MVSGTSQWECRDDQKWHEIGGPVVPNNNNNIPECKAVCGADATVAGFGQQLTGGVVAKKHEFPWMALLSFGQKILFHPDLDLLICGGSIISPNYILTAAHCVVVNELVRTASSIHVWLGVHDRKKAQSELSSVTYSGVSKVTPHPDYNKQLWDSDIAVLRLTTTLVMNDYFRPICLPSTKTDFDYPDQLNHTGIVAGWGLVNTHLTSESLQKARFPIQPDQSVCWSSSVKALQTFLTQRGGTYVPPEDLKLTTNMFCAGYTTDYIQRTCGGDSGGPFMIRQRGKSIVIGLVSFGLSDQTCGKIVSYTVYARLNVPMVQWIHSNTDLK